MMRINSIRCDVDKALNILNESDSTMKSIVIFCNPNKIWGSDRSVRKEVLKYINYLIKVGKIEQKKIKRYLYYSKSKVEYTVFVLKGKN